MISPTVSVRRSFLTASLAASLFAAVAAIHPLQAATPPADAAPTTAPATTIPPAEVTSAIAGAVDPHAKAVATIHPAAAAATQPANQNVTGTVTFSQTANNVAFIADIDGLAPNSKHGFHIHDKGDLSDPELKSAGGHFNPTHEMHGGPGMEHHHLGDLGNLEADASGHAHLEGVLMDVSLVGGDHPISGKSVIIHAKTDDLKSQPAGESGSRVAGGVIEVNK